MTDRPSFLSELKRRRVFRAAALYAVGGWLVIQVAATVLPAFELPSWTVRLVVLLVALGFPIALVLSWLYDVSPAGLRRAAIAIGVGMALLAGVAVAGLAVVSRVEEGPPLRPGRAVHVTSAPGLELDPALSPDGRLVAYAAGQPGRMRIYVQGVTGGRAVQVAESLAVHQRMPRWSPGGADVVFHTGAEELESPGHEGPSSTIYRVPALGGVPRPLTDAATPGFSPAWSRDGRQLAFMDGAGVYGHAIWIMDAAGRGPPRRLVAADEGYGLRWSPDGSMIAYVRNNPRFVLGTAHIANNGLSSIWVVTVRDGRAHRVTAGEGIEISPAWLPDSRSLLFISDRDGVRDVYRLRIRRDGRGRGVPERVTTGLNAHGIDVSADGRTLAYATYTAYSQIWSVPLPRSGLPSLAAATPVTSGNETIEGLALSPDGRWLAYDSDRSGNGDIWKISVDGGAPQQLTTRPEGEYVQDFSPDGRELAFHAMRDGVRHIFVMHADGTDVQQVTAEPRQEGNPDFAPDGNTLAYDAWGTQKGMMSSLYLVARPRRDAAWGAARALGVAGSDASWSPDGRQIAFIQERGLHLVDVRTRARRTLVPADDPAIAAEVQFAYWAADGSTIYFRTFDQAGRSAIWTVPAAGGVPRLLLRLDDPARPSLRREFATDGKRLYFTLASPQADIWVMELQAEPAGRQAR